MKHKQYDYALAIVKSNIMPLHLTGISGVGKTTTAQQIAADLDLDFYTISCTREMGVGHLLGYMDANGNYSGTQFRKAIEHGGVFLLDEINAADSNRLLCLNTIDNGFVSFPDKVISVHPDFRLMAASNPANSKYGARSPMDFSTDNRYYTIEFQYDRELAIQLTSADVIDQVDSLRDFLAKNGHQSITLTMRDELLLHKLINLGLDENPLVKLIDAESEDLKSAFIAKQDEIQAELKRKQAEADKARIQAEIEARKQAEYDALTQHDMPTLSELIAKVS